MSTAEVVAAAFPERVARRRGVGSTDYLLASGTAASLPRGSHLAEEEWLAVADVARTGSAATIRAAAPLDPDGALRLASHLLTDAVRATWTGTKVMSRRVRALGSIELSSVPVATDRDDGRRAVLDALAERGLRAVLGWPESTEQFRRRLALLHHVLGHPWPAVDDASLLVSASTWLGPEVDLLVDGVPASRLDLTSALRRLLPWPEAARLDALAPERIEVPTGSHLRLVYPEDPRERVILAVKLQELFGLSQTPRIVDGRVPVLLHLLSPAQRPLAVTDDLASFWVNAYPAVRAENRGRYAKHPWPEDPMTAPPRRGTTRSGR